MTSTKRRRILIAPSILSADFAHLSREVQEVERAGADYLHVDVMDGRFVPNITVGVPVVAALAKVTSLPLDVHLMIEEPERYIDDFIRAGAKIVSVHGEACRHLHRAVQRIKELGAKASVALNPATPVPSLDNILPELDMVLIMTVNPGFGGQEFLTACLKKVSELRAKSKELALDIEVDGGVNLTTVRQAAEAGANVFVSGHGIFHTQDYSSTIRQMRELARVGA